MITGASSGIGKKAALDLINAGYTVYGAARRIEEMKPLVDVGGYALKLDVTDVENIQRVVDQIVLEQGRIDVLINNAGYAVYGSVEETSEEDYKRQFEVNLFGVAEVTKAVLPVMRKQNKGHIINMSSVGGKIYSLLGAWYHATKHAIEGWSDCLRLEVQPFGIDVTIIEPGLIKTEFGEVMNKPLLTRSGNGPYADLAKGVVKAMESSYNKGDASPPAVISDVILKAIKATKPKTRYHAGRFASQLLFLRKWLSDRAFDKVILSTVNRLKNK
nr:oxidoreductase [Marinibactrum halimedae]